MALTKEKIADIVNTYGRVAEDTGSPEVQIAALSERIKQLSKHLNAYKKDFSSGRGLRKLVSRRRKLLNYLQKNNETRYKEIKEKLGLK